MLDNSNGVANDSWATSSSSFGLSCALPNSQWDGNGGEGVSHGEDNVYLQGLVVSVIALSLEFATQQFKLGILPLLWNAQGAQPLSLENLQVMGPCNGSTAGGQGRG